MVPKKIHIELLFACGIVVLSVILPAIAGNMYWHNVFMLATLYIGAVAMLNVLRGEAGQISFGQGALFGGGAYFTAMATVMAGLNIWVGMLLGVLAAAAMAALLAFPALRVQGYYLGFITVAAAIVFPDLLFAFDEHTRAITGISIITPSMHEPFIGPIDLITVLVLIMGVGGLVIHALVRSSWLGRSMRIAMSSPEAAMSLGISPGRTRFFAFIIAGSWTGAVGAVYAPFTGFVSPGAFPLWLSIFIYFAVVVGGPGTSLGPVMGVWLLYIVPDVLLAEYVEYRLLIYGVIAFAIMFTFPDGIVGSARAWLEARKGQPVGAGQTVSDAVRVVESELRSSAHALSASDHGDDHVLQAKRISKKFGQVEALRDVDIEVRPGEIHGLVGPNGCGKTTLLNVITGLIRPDEGAVILQGENITAWSAHKIGRAGVGRTFQNPRIFDSLTIWQNAVAGSGGGPGYRAGSDVVPRVDRKSVV